MRQPLMKENTRGLIADCITAVLLGFLLPMAGFHLSSWGWWAVIIPWAFGMPLLRYS